MTSPEPEASPSAAPSVDAVTAIPEFPAESPTTSSGLPNPYGLPEIAVVRPEVGVGAAFAGGLTIALILKRLAR